MISQEFHLALHINDVTGLTMSIKYILNVNNGSFVLFCVI